MKNDNEQRLFLLQQALQLDDRFNSVIQALSKYKWDFDGKPETLDKNTLRNILARYLSGELDTNQVHAWADFIELRDDIDYPEDQNDVVQGIVSELANPVSEGELTATRAKELLSILGI